jgi:hypothetical protein
MKNIWNKIISFYSQQNRIMFAFGGWIVTFVMWVFLALLMGNVWAYPVIGLLAPAFAFAGALLKDKFKAEPFNWGDFLAGLTGSLFLVLIMIIVILCV